MRALVVAALVLLAAGDARAAPREIAVMEMTVDGGADPQVGAQMTARLAETIGRRPDVHVLAPDDIRALLEKEAKRQLLGCDEESCLSEIVGALGADVVVKGRLSRIEGGYVLSLSAVDAARVRAIGHVSETWRGESILLLELVAPMADKLLSDAPDKLIGAIAVSGASSGSQVLVDDQLRGTADAVIAAPIGGHRIRVVDDDYAPFERWVVVKTGETVAVPVEQVALESKPFYATWWFWTIAAAGVAGATVAAVAVATSGSGESSPTGASVVINADDAFSGGR